MPLKMCYDFITETKTDWNINGLHNQVAKILELDFLLGSSILFEYSCC